MVQAPPVIDGKLDDPAWDLVDWGGDFIQRQPEDGAAPSQDTKFKILYDAKYLYIGIRAFDLEPNKIGLNILIHLLRKIILMIS